MLPLRHFGNELLDNNIYHSSCGKAEQIRHNRKKKPCGKNGEQSSHRLYSSREESACKCLALAVALCVKGH